jgi:alkanesulfonate monooxygenase SsuD/methylene tetrahydromethanopterin reductase-like flavin-dependent oxidoreductase (luciferase family)
VKTGLLLPTRSLVMVDARRPRTDITLAMVEHAATDGYDHVWVGDSIVAKPRHEPLITLAFLAGRTERLRLGTAVLLPSLRHPVVLANELATLDHLTRGRLILGVAPGWGMPSAAAEMSAVGADIKQRGRRLEEHLQVWRDLWSGRPVIRGGSDFELENHTIGPLPWTEHGPAIWVTAGNRGEFLERAFVRFAQYGDGIITTDVTPEECAEVRRRGEAALAAVGREVPAFPIAVYVTVRLDTDQAAAERAYRQFMTAYYGPQGAYQRGVAAIGTSETVVEALAALGRAGATDVIIRFAGDDQLEQLGAFTRGVKPWL